jgi:polysaccharide deacetylase 2 family uncharacterized protein YibQ
MPNSTRGFLLRAVLAAAVVSAAGCGSWRKAIEGHTPLPDTAEGVSARLVEANRLVEEAVRAADAHAQFPTTLYHERRTPQLFKEVRVFYGASLDTFPSVLDAWLRVRGGRVISTSKQGRRTGEEPWLLVKVKLRVPEKVVCWLEVRRRPPSSARLAIIIDDVGPSTRGLETAAALPSGITFSVLPHTRCARECAEALHESGHAIMLHQPMEPIPRSNGDELDPGPGAVRVGMPPDGIRETVAGNLDAVPHVVAVNNHMGSKATADEATMRAVLLELRERGLPFVDSLTIGTSVCRRVAGELGVPCAVRNAAFLDNSRAPKAMRERLQAACRTARTEGLAITIGHFHPAMLEVLSDFDFGEVELIPVTQLFETAAPAAGRRPEGSIRGAEEAREQ